MADFLSRIMDDNSNVYEDTQNSLLPLNRDGQDDFVLSCMDTQSENSQTFDFMKIHNSNKKESNLEIIREEEPSFYTNMREDFEDAHAKKQNKEMIHANHHTNSAKVNKNSINPHENSKDLLGTANKGKGNNTCNNNLTEKIKKISQEIDDIYEETQRSESVKTKNLGVNDLSSVYTINKINPYPGNYQTNPNINNPHHGHGFQSNNQQPSYGNYNQGSSPINANSNSTPNFQIGKTYQNNNQNNSFIPANNLSNVNNYNNSTNIYPQNPKLNILNSLNSNNNNQSSNNPMANNPINPKTKTKANITYTTNVSNNGTPVGFYNPNENMGGPVNLNKTNNFPNPGFNNNTNNLKNIPSTNFELSNSFRVETDENIKKAIVIFDNVKMNFCNFIDNYKNKFIHDAELVKQVLVQETDYVMQEEEKNRLIDSRMETLFRDMMNILNEFQRY